jgi:tRNA (cytidine/uridine-2'-O-)-methyltransferase
MFNIVLIEPEIPPNTGNIIRLCANTGCRLHLVEPLGFNFDDKHMRRAGLDYHEYAQLQRHANWSAFLKTCQPATQRMFAMTTKGSQSAFEVQFQPGDWFVFGCETRGLPPVIRDQFQPDRRLRLPMRADQRSLNLSNAVAIMAYEAWRQQGFVHAAQ